MNAAMVLDNACALPGEPQQNREATVSAGRGLLRERAGRARRRSSTTGEQPLDQAASIFRTSSICSVPSTMTSAFSLTSAGASPPGGLTPIFRM